MCVSLAITQNDHTLKPLLKTRIEYVANPKLKVGVNKSGFTAKGYRCPVIKQFYASSTNIGKCSNAFKQQAPRQHPASHTCTFTEPSVQGQA